MATAFSPASLTGFFRPRFGPDPDRTASAGFAVCLDVGVTAAVRPAARQEGWWNGQAFDLPTVRAVVAALAPQPVAVEVNTRLPLGCGFGVSAAAALAAGLAVNERFALGHTRDAIGRLAHRAEVENGTGVGDVAAQLSGGLVYRRCIAGPFDSVRLDGVTVPDLFITSFGPLSTREVLTSPTLRANLEAAGDRAIAWLDARHADVTLGELLDRSLQFTEEVGLLTDGRVRDAIEQVRSGGGKATMILLGQSVLATAAAGPGWTRCGLDRGGGARVLP